VTGHVFHDPSGRRARRTKLTAGALGAVLFALIAAFAATLAVAPKLPEIAFRSPRALSALHSENAHKHEPSWLSVLHRRHFAKVPTSAARPLTVGFYVSWDEDARSSLRRNVDHLDVVAPQWVSLTSASGAVELTADPQARAIIRSAKKPPAIVALVINAQNGVWDGGRVQALFDDKAARARLISTLVATAEREGWAGVGFDFENLSPRAVRAYPAFLAEARAALKPKGRQVWATVPFDDKTWPVARLQASLDQIVLMGYDEHWGTGTPGPAAGQGWYEENLNRLGAILDPNHTILALGSYGYDWVRGGGTASVASFHEATLAAKDSGATIGFDPQGLNPSFSYRDDEGSDHDVWFLDAVSLFNQVKVADAWRPHGYAVWRLGTEDPGVWTVLGQPYGAATTAGLTKLDPGEDVDYDGNGEVLRVTGTPHTGRRDLTVDPDSGLISDERYSVIPTAYVVQRLGFHPGDVALTFDDGPDPRWTGKILDVLKREHAPATFFVIGENMERHPELVQREIDEGQVVGSHTYTHPNIGEIPQTAAALELNATQRLFETITGRSMRLFRPPFFGDADPSTPNEVAPLLTAQALGYISVGLRVDPGDWKKPKAEQIVERVMERLDHPGARPGQIVLLHDSGGDRAQTLKALPILIRTIRAHGYHLVSVPQLAGMTPAQAMPPTARDSYELAVDRTAFFLVRNLEAGVKLLLISAIVLGVLRLLFLGGLSLLHAWRGAEPPPLPAPGEEPLVSVLIPCFNEEAVIESSVRRILASTWRRIEVLVLDDGSADATGAVVEHAFADEPRVRLLRFENGGKARALNRGLKLAKGDIVVALDADTLFPEETLGRLVRWFADPKVGAVAGNAMVGNRVNLLTRWQALEYVVAQNLERRALALLGAVTVVPGAVGAWRRSALDELGGYPADTLAEDQDLTLAVQERGWKVLFDPEARAFTESPDTVSGLLKQRFRWSFGTLQCLWKHRSMLFSRKVPGLGFVALPQVWLFQILLTVIAPLVDLAVVWSLGWTIASAMFHPVEWSAEDLIRTTAYWAAFVLLDLAAGLIAMAMESRAPWSDLKWLPLQRFGYRQLMYAVVLKAVSAAINGGLVGWGKLDRKATATLTARS
jgi:cellulose synthase/poly-beta-1,6-N-acetylglucosamine synthase-like glycosyltransferase/spore germination protein YaaH/peptidoglycan/xylan/chitin deacetylase (PgdA/CDA1 family)